MSSSVLYLPRLNSWWSVTTETFQATFTSCLLSLPPSTSLIVIATAECPWNDLPSSLKRLFDMVSIYQYILVVSLTTSLPLSLSPPSLLPSLSFPPSLPPSLPLFLPPSLLKSCETFSVTSSLREERKRFFADVLLFKPLQPSPNIPPTNGGIVSLSIRTSLI